MTKIMYDNNDMLDAFNPHAIARAIALRMRQRRLEQNLTQQTLANKSGVSLGSLKRFEHHFEISLKHLLMLAVILDATAEFSSLFSGQHFESIDQVLKATAPKQRQRGSKNA